jgi:tyrosyl-tRNA synthetase
MIGDPKDSGERTLNSLDTVKEWVERVRRQIEPFLSFEGENAATMVNNYDWTASLSTIDFLRDVGKHFPVNRMLARDVVKSRLEAGISYTEFSYVLLQSMDFLNLYRDHGVILQFGGSDQWGNLTGGVELIRRSDGGQGARVRDPTGHQVRRHEVRQDRGRRPVARPGDDVAVRLLPVLAQRRGREGR